MSGDSYVFYKSESLLRSLSRPLISPRLYSNDWEEKVRIFNRVYEEEHTLGLRNTTIATQWHDMWRDNKGQEIVRQIQGLSLAQARTNYPDIREHIEAAASHLSIILQLRPVDLVVKKKRRRPSNHLRSRQRGLAGVLGSEGSEDESTLPPSRRRKTIPKSRDVLQIPFSQQVLTPVSIPSDHSITSGKLSYTEGGVSPCLKLPADAHSFSPFNPKTPFLGYRVSSTEYTSYIPYQSNIMYRSSETEALDSTLFRAFVQAQ